MSDFISSYIISESGITTTVMSATTYYGDGSNLSNISLNDYYVTGGTYSGDTLTLTRNDGNDVVVNGFFSGFTISGDSGIQTVDNGENIRFDGGSGLTVNVTSPNLVTYNYDINNMTTEISPQTGDKLLLYDSTSGTHKNVDWSQLPGAGGGGEVNTASNVGGANGIFYQKSGVDLEFRSLSAGTNINILSATTTLTISTTAEANTASNLGSGFGVFAQKSGVDLQFKSFSAGTNVTLTSGATQLNFSVPTLSDSLTSIINTTNNTKVAKLDSSQISPSTTRTFGFQDRDGTLALTSDLTTGEVSARAYIYATNNATSTPITTNVFSKLLGTTTEVSGYSLYFSAGTDNRLTFTYTGGTAYLQYTINTAISSSNNNNLLIAIAKNGIVDNSTQMAVTTFGGTATSVPCSISGIVSMAANDYIELWATNTTAGNPIILKYLNFGIKS